MGHRNWALLLLPTVAAGLVGCNSQDDEAVFMAACTAGSGTEICSCEFQKAQEELSAYTFGVMVEAAKIPDGAEAVRFLRDNLSREQETAYFQSRMRWIIECGEGEASLESAPTNGGE
ncbi:MAG: hypothetical protein AAGJ32_13110 [Pseudomonadota bacterium]